MVMLDHTTNEPHRGGRGRREADQVVAVDLGAITIGQLIVFGWKVWVAFTIISALIGAIVGGVWLLFFAVLSTQV